MKLRVLLDPPRTAKDDLLELAAARKLVWRTFGIGQPTIGAHRDLAGRLYFDLRVRDAQPIRDLFVDCERIRVEEMPGGEEEEECLNCGNISGGPPPTICPNCRYRDISACPHCHQEVPRTEYETITNSLFRCPRCRTHVRMMINPQLFAEDGHLNEPAVLIALAEGEEQ
jgi:hypothetical protein